MLGETDAKALAGGQTFIPVLKQRLNKPSAVIVDLAKLGLDRHHAPRANTVIIVRCDDHDTATVAAFAREAKKSIAGLVVPQCVDDRRQRRCAIAARWAAALANNDPSACYPIGACWRWRATIKTDRRSIARR